MAIASFLSMSEGQIVKELAEDSISEGQLSKKNKGISRRAFLKGAGLLAATIPLGVGATVVKKDILTGIEGFVRTNEGKFYPLYERHDVGISLKDAPRNLDVLYRELVIPNLFSSDPRYLVSNLAKHQNGKNVIDSDVLFNIARLARDGTEVMFGDTMPPLFLSNKPGGYAMGKEGKEIVNAAALVAVLAKTLEKFATPEVKKETDGNFGVSRRQFLKSLKVLALGSLVWAITPPITSKVLDLALTDNRQNAIKRVAARLNGIAHNFHPEDMIILFRNLLMADRLMTAAQEVKKRKGRVPSLAFQVGAGHAGIEDFLHLGPDITRALIANWPVKEALKSAIDYNGGIENFCSSRLFLLPKDSEVRDLYDKDKPFPIKERRITDMELQQALTSRFS